MISRTLRVRHKPYRPRYGYFPTIARLENSLKIMVYSRDPTHGPHVHVAYEGDEGNPTRLRIDDGTIIGTRSSVKAQDLRAARVWLTANRADALRTWNKLNPHTVRTVRRVRRRKR
jgi:Domain of unknown function (DUF4160)